MTLISVHVSTPIHVIFATLNLVACSICAGLRVHHQRKYRTDALKINAMGLSCILAALLHCLALVNAQAEWYFGDERYCDLSIKLSAATYTLHRALLYMFIILRLEVVNQANFIKQRIIDTGKVVIGAMGIVMVVCSVVFSKGVPGRYYSCAFEVNETVLLMMFVIDVFICVGGTWMFTRPITLTLRSLDSSPLSLMLGKTKFWSIVCLVSALISMLTVAIVDGAGGVVGFDCSITSFGLLMMMKPQTPMGASKSSSNINQNIDADVVVEVELKNVVKENSCSSLRTSSLLGFLTGSSFLIQLRSSEIRLNREIESVLNLDSSTDIKQEVHI